MKALTITQSTALMQPGSLADIGAVANGIAARHVFDDYRSRRATNTLRRQARALAMFTEYLTDIGVADAEDLDLAHDPLAWRGITWGLVAGFVQWLLQAGYAIGTVNVRLSTVRTYAKLAFKAGALDRDEYATITTVGGYRRKEAESVDEQREAAGMATRYPGDGGDKPLAQKKAEAVVLSPEQAAALKALDDDTPRGRRDRLILSLMLDHGLRVGEIEALAVGNLDLETGELRFYRSKVSKWQTHRLSGDALAAARAYIEHDALAMGPLLRASRKDGRLHEAGMTARAITRRVRDLGERLEIAGLSAHDLRHTWATRAARAGTPIDRLQDAGGWNSYAMPLRYVEAARIANAGVRLG